MVDIIKSFPQASTSFPLRSQYLRSKTYNQPVILPIYISKSTNLSTKNRLQNNQTKRWIGNFPPNSSRLLDVSNSPYSLHRKIMYQELSRHCPITEDSEKAAKNKQRNLNREKTKISMTTITTTTTTAIAGANLTPQPSSVSGDARSSRLFDTLSKHVTIKPEPLRASNGFCTNTTATLTSWQRYWTSTHIQRRRKEAVESDPGLYRPRREQSIPSQTHFVVLRDSLHPCGESHQYDSLTSTSTNTDTSIKTYSSSITLNKELSMTKENDTKKPASQASTIELNASPLIRSWLDMNSSTIVSKPSATKSTEKEDENYLSEKSLLSSSHFKSDSQIIEDVLEAQIDPQPITPKVYKLLLPERKSKSDRKSPLRGRTRSKSAEKREALALSAEKRKRQLLTGRKSTNRSSDLSTIMTTTSVSKYVRRKWDAPYVGLRFDPPTPPSSPSLFIWFEDSDQEDNDLSHEKSEIFEHHLPDIFLNS